MKKLFGFGGSSNKELAAGDGHKSKLPRHTTSAKYTQSASGKVKLSEQSNGLTFQKSRRRVERGQTSEDNDGNGVFIKDEILKLCNLPKQSEGEQIAAGWPAWLSGVAGEALMGWIPRRADTFEKIDKIGQGTYSNVYKARDLASGKIVALKKVRCDTLEPHTVRFMAREIKILRRLDHPNVVKLEGLVTSRLSSSLYLVFQYMDHDLTGLISSSDIKFTEAQVKCCMIQILKGLDHCHSRGVLHRDLKGSNILLDSQGNLKLADFGLATFFQPGEIRQMTTRVVTLWYRPPELLLGAKEYGVAIDLWSTGCILAELFTGRPIMPGRTEVEQLHKIFKLCGSPTEEYWQKHKLPHAGIFKPQRPYKQSMSKAFKDFPQTTVNLLHVLLAIDPDSRGSASSALNSEFFSTKPFACDPSCLPKYSPSKDDLENIKDNSSKREKAVNRRVHRSISSRKDRSREEASENTALPNVKNEEASALQRLHRATNKKQTRRSNSKKEGLAVVEFPNDNKEVPKNHADALPSDSLDAQAKAVDKKEDEFHVHNPRLTSRSGRYAHLSDLKFPGINGTKPPADLSSLSSLVAARNSGSQELHKGLLVPWQQEKKPIGVKGSNHILDRMESFKANDWDQDSFYHERPGQMKSGDNAQRIHFAGPIVSLSTIHSGLPDEQRQRIQKALLQARHAKIKQQRERSPPAVMTNCGTVGSDDAEDISISRLRTAKSHYLGETYSESPGNFIHGYAM